MSTLFWVGIAAHIGLCLLLVLLVLVQNDKAGGLGSAFGGGGGNAAFSGAGAESFIQKFTRIVAFMFMTLVFLLSISAKNSDTKAPESKMEKAVSGLGASLPGTTLPDMKLPAATPQNDAPAAEQGSE